MSDNSRSGNCLCGKVALTMETTSNRVEACHCSMCRTWGGGPLLSFEPCKNLSVQGEEFITVYKSSEWAERAFCNSCGTHLYYKLVETKEYMVPPGLMTGSEELELCLEVFIDEKPDYYSFSEEVTRLTGQQAIEHFEKILAEKSLT